MSEGRGLPRGEHLPVERLPGDRAVDQPFPDLLPRGFFQGGRAPLLVAQGEPRLHGRVSLLLALLLADLRLVRDRAVLLALPGQRPPERADRHPTLLLEPRAGREVVRDLAAVLRVEQVRLGDPVSADLQGRRRQRRQVLRRRAGPLLVETLPGGRLRPGPAAALHLVAERRARLHLGRAAELLLAKRRRQ